MTIVRFLSHLDLSIKQPYRGVVYFSFSGGVVRVIGPNDEINATSQRRSMISPVKLIDLLHSRPCPSFTFARSSRTYPLCPRSSRVFRLHSSDLFFLDLADAEIGLSPGKV